MAHKNESNKSFSPHDSSSVFCQRQKFKEFTISHAVANGPKDHIAEQEDFESWRSTQQHHQGYTTPISTTSDPYTMSNYYNTGFTGKIKLPY